MIVEAIRDLILATPLVAGRLDDYDFGDGVMRASVHTRKAPNDAPGRLITIMQSAGEPIGNRRQHGAAFDVDVNVYGDKILSDAELRTIAMSLWETFNRGTLTISDWNFRGMMAQMPEQIEDEDGFPGYNVSVSVQATKEITT